MRSLRPHPLLPLLLLAAAAACTPRAQEPRADAEQLPDVTLYGVRLQSFEGEALAAAGRAERATYQRGTGSIVASQMVLRLPSRPGSPRAVTHGLEVRAQRLEGNLASRQADASGGVLLRTSTGVVGRSPSAHVDGATRNIRGREPVTLQGPNYRHRADSFQLALDTEVFTFEGSVQSDFEGASQNGVKQ